jgi:hypothetical protein
MGNQRWRQFGCRLGSRGEEGGIAERPATPSGAVACGAERARRPVPAVGYGPRGCADRLPPGRGRGDAWPRPGAGASKVGHGTEPQLVEMERRQEWETEARPDRVPTPGGTAAWRTGMAAFSLSLSTATQLSSILITPLSSWNDYSHKRQFTQWWITHPYKKNCYMLHG